jgi:hypothetical protein
MGSIRGLFMALIIIVFALALLPTVNTSAVAITTTTYGVGVSGIANLYPLFFTMIGFFAVFEVFKF